MYHDSTILGFNFTNNSFLINDRQLEKQGEKTGECFCVCFWLERESEEV